MHLIIDIGNTNVKIAIMQHRNIVVSYSYTGFSATIVGEILSCYPSIRAAIISTTRKRDSEAECYVKSKIPHTIIFDHTTLIPIVNLYATPETLGMDRLAAAVGAWSILPNEELLIFDFGTAITIDRVTSRGEYIGGNISPGMNTRFGSLNHFTQKLPLVKYEDIEKAPPMGTTTTQAIWNGVMLGIEHEIEGYINKNPSAKLFFTGADAKYFVKCRENAIFVDCELVIKGLEQILEYNAKESNI